MIPRFIIHLYNIHISEFILSHPLMSFNDLLHFLITKFHIHLMRFCLLGSMPQSPLLADFHRQATPAKQAFNPIPKSQDICQTTSPPSLKLFHVQLSYQKLFFHLHPVGINSLCNLIDVVTVNSQQSDYFKKFFEIDFDVISINCHLSNISRSGF